MKVTKLRSAEQRRRELLDAAEELIADQGIHQVKLRDIAGKAGMTPNAALYYFETLEAIFEDVLARSLTRYCDDRQLIADGAEPPAVKLRKLISAGLPGGPEDRLGRLIYEMGSFARTDAASAARYITLFERQVAIYMGVLEAGAARGDFRLGGPAREIARSLVVMEDGLGLALTNKVQTLRKEEAVALLETYAGTMTGLSLREENENDA
ncbi:AcrR family transcriptional regulator [Gellertiella hungarica]|uniref:AcrR family transcriptional regulator n=1 Tax=Gellertiella hungarica TaxID=1572859 RepID=A0A7W6J1I8_9HYPH|nr:TetR/AcrR family transcriptional regulator [Gellertiella hungarica]MBB4063086.1 AcrR family transcriptional regulator [Gellertiella hungarica]